MADGSWRWTAEPPATYPSGPGVWRDFCGKCGSLMAYRFARFPGEVHFYAASPDDPSTYTPEGQVFSAEAMPWVHLPDNLPRRWCRFVPPTLMTGPRY